MDDKRKNNAGQPKKPEGERKVPLTFHVKAKNKTAIHTKLLPTVKKLDV